MLSGGAYVMEQVLTIMVAVVAAIGLVGGIIVIRDIYKNKQR